MRGLRHCLVLLLALLTIPVAAQQRPIDDFATLPLIERPVLSPDGNRLVAQIGQGGRQFLAVLSFAGGKPVLLGTGENDLNWWRWVGNDWLVVGIGREVPVGSQTIYVRRAVAVSADGKQSRVLAERDAAQSADDVIWASREGTPRVLLSVQKSLYLDRDFWPSVIEYDLTTGRGKTVVGPREGVLEWYADADGVVRMGIGATIDGRSRRLLYRDTASAGFRTVDTARRAGERLTVPAMFLPEPGKALAIADDPDGFGALYALDLQSLTLKEKLYGVNGYDIGWLVGDARGDRALGVALTDERARTHWLDPDFARIQQQVDAAVGKRSARIVSMSDDRGRLLLHIAAADQPGGYYIFDLDGERMKHFAWVSDRLKGARLHPVSTIRYPAKDGTSIAAVVTTPKSAAAGKPLPLIVMPHGGPFARDAEEWDWWAQFLADRGYLVVQPNYRGSSGYGTKFAELGEGQWGLAMQDDLNAAITHLAAAGKADPARVCIVGGSYGGYAALRAAERDPRLYRCAVSFAGVSDLPRLQRYDAQFLRSGARKDWLRTQAPDLRAVSPINNARGFGIPVLMVHGRKDRRVQVSHSREMAERLRGAGKDVTYVEQPEGDHFLTREADRRQFLQLIEQFLAKHNPA